MSGRMGRARKQRLRARVAVEHEADPVAQAQRVQRLALVSRRDEPLEVFVRFAARSQHRQDIQRLSAERQKSPLEREYGYQPRDEARIEARLAHPSLKVEIIAVAALD